MLLALLSILVAWVVPLAAQEPSFEIEEWEKRLNRRQPPVEIMDAIDLRPGTVVGEIGAGSGRMTLWLAERVGPKGRIYANDIDKKALKKLERRRKKEELTHLEVIHGEVLDPLLPEATLDLLFMINVYHHADDPVELLRNARPSLKPQGRLAIVECDPDKTDWGREHGCAGREQMTRQLDDAGYDLIRIESFLAEDSIYLFAPRPTAAPANPG